MNNNTTKSSEVREREIQDLLEKMTLKEKISQLGSVLPGELIQNGEFSEAKARKVLKDGIGHITKPGGESGFPPEDTAKFIDRIQNFLKEETRLGIPALVHEESLSGYMGVGGTSYPQSIGLASSWNPDLVKDITSNIRMKIRALGVHQVLAPVLDLARDLRWGRVEETYGEDPYLVAVMGSNYIKGLQGEDPRNGVYATAKHFGGHGAPEGGRNHSPVNISERELRENFLFPFEVAVRKDDIEAVMSAYHDIDGIPCSCSEKLLTETLRKEWEFDGFIISDGHSIKMLHAAHSVAENEQGAGVKALKAGLDLEGPTIECFNAKLIDAIESGSLSKSTLNKAVTRHLNSKYRKGLLDNREVKDHNKIKGTFGNSENTELNQKASRESIILLKNENNLLPISKEIESIAVIGPNADNKRNMLGDYAYGGHMEKSEASTAITTVLEGIKNKISGQTRTFYEKGCEIHGESRKGFEKALKVANQAEIAIAVVGGKSGFGFFPPEKREENFDQTSGEGNDRTDLQLPGSQKDLLKEIHKTGTPLVVILVNGRPLSINWCEENLPAILEGWLPGEQGGNAIADVLFGDYNPGGKLPVTVPKNVGQCPMHYRRKRISKNRRYVFTDSQPLYPFGFGLSYTNFDYSNLTLEKERIRPATRVNISCKVENTGDRFGKEVVQLYIRDELASITRPERELKGFKKIGLEPGESKKVLFHLHTDMLAFYDKEMNRVVEPGKFKVMVGSSSKDIRLSDSISVLGEKTLATGRLHLTGVEAD